MDLNSLGFNCPVYLATSKNMGRSEMTFFCERKIISLMEKTTTLLEFFIPFVNLICKIDLFDMYIIIVGKLYLIYKLHLTQMEIFFVLLY